MQFVAEVLLGIAVVAVTASLSFAIIVVVYRLCCHPAGARRATTSSGSRDDADRMLLSANSCPRSPRSDVKQLKRSAVKTDARGAGLYAGVKALR